jgi:hypothetical protein
MEGGTNLAAFSNSQQSENNATPEDKIHCYLSSRENCQDDNSRDLPAASDPSSVKKVPMQHIKLPPKNPTKSKDLVVSPESTVVHRWKWTLIFLLVLSAILLATGAFVLVSREEEANHREAVGSVQLQKRHSTTAAFLIFSFVFVSS